MCNLSMWTCRQQQLSHCRLLRHHHCRHHCQEDNPVRFLVCNSFDEITCMDRLKFVCISQLLSPVYTIQSVVKTFNRLWNPFDNRFDNRLYLVSDIAIFVLKRDVKLQPTNRLYQVYSWLSNRLYNPVSQPVERTAVRSTRLSNRLSNPFDNRFDNRLYHVNGLKR